MNTYRCPTNADQDDKGPSSLIGCGAVFDAEPDFEGLVDCPHCGIWFRATEPGVQVTKEDGNALGS